MKQPLAFAYALACCSSAVADAQHDEAEDALERQTHWLSASPDAPQIAFLVRWHEVVFP
ncbi:MAG: hypothetical protein OEN21_13505 [Myxococcales bacterium]|nr:hypothetical protein [Myxococcales bacterium]